jgi:peptidoglycan pentaglycine glycine transferase (the first glycine)
MPTLVNDPTFWNSALATLPLAHVLQTWEWGQFKARHGWTPRYLLWQDEARGDAAGKPHAAALVLRRQLGRLPLRVMYVPKGPALDYGDPSMLNTVLSDLEALARRERAIFIKIDPDLELETRNSKLENRGWVESNEQIQFRNTMTIDLAQDEDTLLAAMNQKTRYNIRLAARKGVTVREGRAGDLELLYDMYRETAQRDGFIIRPLDYYEDAWGSFIRAGLGQPLVAEVESQPVAALILFQFARTAYYFYGMSRDVHRDKMPNHLLQWEAMRWARQHGCTTYDLWGAPDTLDESDSMYGVYRFKQGFGARFVQHVGAWDYAASPLLYWLYTVAMPRVIALMHQRHEARGRMQDA